MQSMSLVPLEEKQDEVYSLIASMTITFSFRGFLPISAIKEQILKYVKDQLLNYPEDQIDLISVGVCFT